MKKFDIITEADARVLERGTVVELAAGGHVTPLAQDTLRERRITVAREGRTSRDDSSLVPVADIRSVAIGSDQAGLELLKAIVGFLRGRGLAVDDQSGGTSSAAPVAYPEAAARVARSVASREADAGIVVDASGLGSAIAANKMSGIRAAMAGTERIARHAREHEGVNVLTLGASFVTPDEALAIVSAWLTTAMRDPQALDHFASIRDLERR
jgi:ribose 5-phosphate isomerase B